MEEGFRRDCGVLYLRQREGMVRIMKEKNLKVWFWERERKEEGVGFSKEMGRSCGAERASMEAQLQKTKSK